MVPFTTPLLYLVLWWWNLSKNYGQSLVSLQICTEMQVKKNKNKNRTPCLNSFWQGSSLAVSCQQWWKPGTLPLTGRKDRGNYVSTDPGGSKDRLGKQGQSKNSSDCLSASPKKRKCYSKSKLFKRKHKLNSCSLPSQKDSITSYLSH